MSFLEKLFESDFMPHGHCYMWLPEILWLHVVSDATIALAYFSIPVAITLFVRRRTDLAKEYRWVFVLFAAFILLCGFTHVAEIWAVWNGTYRFTGVLKAMTGAVSVATAVLLWPLLPKVLELPSPGDLQRSQKNLRRKTRQLDSASAARQEAEQMAEAAFDNAPIGKALVSTDGRWLRVNRALCKLFGLPATSLLEKTFQELTHPDDLEADLELVEQMLAGEIRSYGMEKRYYRADGSVMWAELSVSAVRDENDAVRFFVSQIQDISERRAAEELRLRNAELSQFAFAASHDLQEPLRKIAGFSELLLKDYGDALDDRGRHFAQRIIASAERLQDLIQALLSLSRLGRSGLDAETLDLGDVVDEAIENLELQLKDSGGTIERTILPTIEADRRALTQLFQNLFSNSLKFSGDEAPRIRVDLVRRKDGIVTLAVEDNGLGIEPRHAERIFEVFQRLHSTDEHPGTGIGLALCRKAVEIHGGSIRLDGDFSGGARFLVQLPEELPTDPHRPRSEPLSTSSRD